MRENADSGTDAGADYGADAGAKDRAMRRHVCRRCVDGVMAGWALMLGLIWTDVGRVGTLIDGSEHGALALTMLALVFASTGAAAGTGLALFALPVKVDSGPADSVKAGRLGAGRGERR